MLHSEFLKHIADEAARLSMEVWRLRKALPSDEETSETLREMLQIAEYSLDNVENFCIRLSKED